VSYRCNNAFVFGGRVFPGGIQVEDDDPILETHGANFAHVTDLRPGTETATSAPGAPRDLANWLAAEDKHKADVAEWLAAESEAAASKTESESAPAQDAKPAPAKTTHRTRNRNQ